MRTEWHGMEAIDDESSNAQEDPDAATKAMPEGQAIVTRAQWAVAGNVDTPPNTSSTPGASPVPRCCLRLAHAFGKNLVREPDAGNPHVRFDERGRETGLWQAGLRRWPRKSQHGHRKPKVTAPVLDSTDLRATLAARKPSSDS